MKERGISMKKNLLLVWMTCIFMLVLVACGGNGNEATDDKQTDPGTEVAKPVELTISAAASLQDAMEEIKTEFAKEESNISLAFNFGGSGALQQQISEGAPVDMFFSAAQDKYDKLVEEGRIAAADGKTLLGNELVLIAPADATIDGAVDFTYMADAAIKQVSIGTPESVPAGKYAEQVLNGLGVYDAVKDKIVFAKDVRTVLNYVETKSVELGVVYKTDALTTNDVQVLASAPTDLHDAIVYPVGVIKDSANKEAAMKFYEYLQTQAALDIFVKYGFTVLQ